VKLFGKESLLLIIFTVFKHDYQVVTSAFHHMGLVTSYIKKTYLAISLLSNSRSPTLSNEDECENIMMGGKGAVNMHNIVGWTSHRHIGTSIIISGFCMRVSHFFQPKIIV